MDLLHWHVILFHELQYATISQMQRIEVSVQSRAAHTERYQEMTLRGREHDTPAAGETHLTQHILPPLCDHPHTHDTLTIDDG
jgi:hypothetical protein